MKTYSDLLEVGERAQDRMLFVQSAIAQHKGSLLYQEADIAEDYDRHRNRTIREYQKLLYTVTGRAVPDNYSANYKIASRFFNRFVTQEVQYLLGNGVTWEDSSTAEKLGDDFDAQLQEIGKDALVGGVAFGFFDLDKLKVFKVAEFVPIYDEENGALMAGIRFWQVATDKPLRATLYEIDGYTDYIWEDGKGRELNPKRAYKLKITGDQVDADDGTEIYDGENYPTFPIVPLWGNPHHQSELVGIREQIDAYDLIKSGFANTIDEASFVYWTIQNAGGMDDVDLAKFVERMKTVHASVLDDDAQAQEHSVESPYQGREALLDRLEKDMYKDFMALDVENIASGATTATQIKAAYEPINSKANQFEYCVKEFLKDIMNVAGVEDSPTFTRSTIVNTQEEVNTVLASAEYLSPEYVTEKIMTLLGDADQVESVLSEMDAEHYNALTQGEPTEPTEGAE